MKRRKKKKKDKPRRSSGPAISAGDVAVLKPNKTLPKMVLSLVSAVLAEVAVVVVVGEGGRRAVREI